MTYEIIIVTNPCESQANVLGCDVCRDSPGRDVLDLSSACVEELPSASRCDMGGTFTRTYECDFRILI